LSLGLVATMLLQLLFGHLSDKRYASPILLLGLASIFLVDHIFPVSSAFMLVLICYVLLRSAAVFSETLGWKVPFWVWGVVGIITFVDSSL